MLERNTAAAFNAAVSYADAMYNDLLRGHEFVTRCEQAAKNRELIPGDVRRVRDLAVRLVAQHQQDRLPFTPGTRVTDGRRTGTVICGKPSGFHERPRWDFHNSRPITDHGRSFDLAWIVVDGTRGISQVAANDWMLMDQRRTR